MKALGFVVIALLLGGCAASGGEDPFAYTRKPLYAGGFDLARIGPEPDSQEFRVTDGSIAEIRLDTWINATAGGGHVVIVDPSGSIVLDTREPATLGVGLALGVWTVHVEADPDSTGIVHILATRA